MCIHRDGKTLEIGITSVKKTYRADLATERVRYLRNVYEQLKKKDVPHVDVLVYSVDVSVWLEPKGIAVRPENERGVLDAIICVLRALVV